MDDLRSEVNHWRIRFEEAQRQIEMMKRDQMGVIGATYENIGQMHRLHNHNVTLHSQVELESIRNQELLNTIKKLTLENEALRHRLDEFDDSTKHSMASLTHMLSDKGKDVHDMKWKLNDALEIKRRVEMDKETMMFELENLRARYVADLKEKYPRLKQGPAARTAAEKLRRHARPEGHRVQRDRREVPQNGD